MVYSKKYFTLSLILHAIIIVLASVISSYSRVIRNQFIIFGIHSRKPTVVLYKKKRLKPKKISTSTVAIKKFSAKKVVAKQPLALPVKKLQKAKNITHKDFAKKIKAVKKIAKKKSSLKKLPQVEKKKIVKKKTKDKQGKQLGDTLKKEESSLPSEVVQKKKDAEEKSMKTYQQHIQRAISREWRPLVGVEKGTLCRVLFTVSDLGKVIEARLVKRSGIVLYDLSVMKVAKKIEFHKSLWDREFTVDFSQ